MDIKQFFVDGIANLQYRNGTFRFELASYGQPDKSDGADKNKAKLNRHAQVVMAPQSFIQVAETMQRFIKEIEDKGIIKFNKQDDSTDIEDEVTKAKH